MAAIFKSSLQNLSPLPTSLKVESLVKPKTGLKFFVNTTKPKTKVLAVLGQKLEDKSLNFKPKPWLRPFVNTGSVLKGNVSFSVNTNYTIIHSNVM